MQQKLNIRPELFWNYWSDFKFLTLHFDYLYQCFDLFQININLYNFSLSLCVSDRVYMRSDRYMAAFIGCNPRLPAPHTDLHRRKPFNQLSLCMFTLLHVNRSIHKGMWKCWVISKTTRNPWMVLIKKYNSRSEDIALAMDWLYKSSEEGHVHANHCCERPPLDQVRNKETNVFYERNLQEGTFGRSLSALKFCRVW